MTAAAPGYLTDAHWNALDEDWLEQALAYAAAPIHGIPGPLTRIRPRPGRNDAPALTSAGRPTRHVEPEGRPGAADETVYTLADYLDQDGRRSRRGEIPPEFWSAAANLANPADLGALAGAAAGLVRTMNSVHPGDQAPARWVARHAVLGNPYSTALLLGALRDVGADEQATALAARVPWPISTDQFAAPVALDATDVSPGAWLLELPDPLALGAGYDRLVVGTILDALRAVTRRRLGVTLADLAAAHPVPGCRSAAGFLLAVLQQADCGEATLRPGDADAVVVHTIVGTGGRAQLVMSADFAHGDLPLLLAGTALSRLYARATTCADPGTRQTGRLEAVPAGSVRRSTGSEHLIITDSRRNSPSARPPDPQVAVLLGRAVAHVALKESSDVAFLLEALQETGAGLEVDSLLSRAPAIHVALDNAHGVARLLDALRQAGAHQQADTLLSREPAAHVALDNAAFSVDRLLDALQRAGAHQQAAVIRDRLPREGLFGLFLEQGDNKSGYRFGRELDGSPSPEWHWEDLG